MSDRVILVPTDFSEQSKAALQYASALAKDPPSKLLILHVRDTETPPVEGLDPVDALEGLDAILHRILPNDPSVGYSHRLVDGVPAAKILEIAKEENAELIVMGTHGRSGLSRFVMGSVTEAVLRQAECPVMTLRQPASRPTPAS